MEHLESLLMLNILKNVMRYLLKVWNKLVQIYNLISENLEFNPLIKLAEIDPRDIEDAKSVDKKTTDIRGTNNRVIKKILRKTVEVACKSIMNYPKDDDDSETKKFHTQLAILNA